MGSEAALSGTRAHDRCHYDKYMSPISGHLTPQAIEPEINLTAEPSRAPHHNPHVLNNTLLFKRIVCDGSMSSNLIQPCSLETRVTIK